MRDKKDNATIDLLGFEPAERVDSDPVSPSPQPAAETKRRPRRAAPKQEQLQLLDLADTDVTGLPMWKHDPSLDLTGLPIWQPAK
ncbi:hypothetical protein [Massilia sp. 9096]|uniref:hypothetical protein n=1 Tax=Massilia sp. 9096 TaxID=1500894 RepID=UPI00055FE39F|nr:hypothetical protein [Massilia sp. 9096]